MFTPFSPEGPSSPLLLREKMEKGKEKKRKKFLIIIEPSHFGTGELKLVQPPKMVSLRLPVQLVSISAGATIFLVAYIWKLLKKLYSPLLPPLKFMQPSSYQS